MENNRAGKIAAILSLAFLTMGVSTTTPALASIGRAFPAVDHNTLMLVSTMPSIIAVPVTIATGKLAMSRVKCRTLAVAGILIFIIAGIAPYFLHDFRCILISRAAFGAGLGTVSPLASILILHLFVGNTRENLMGVMNFFSNIGGIVFQFLGGLLCSFSWQDTFLTYLLAAVPLVIVILLLPEPPPFKGARKETGPQKMRVSPWAVLWILVYFAFTLFLYPMFLNISSIIIDGGYGTAAAAGFVLTMFTVGGMVSSALFGAAFRTLKHFIISAGFLLTAVGFVCLAAGHNLMLLIVGCVLAGLGFGLVAPTVILYVGLSVPPPSRAMVVSLTMAFANFGGFLSPYFFSLVKTVGNIPQERFPFFCSLAYFAAVALLFVFVKKSPRPCGGSELD